MFAVHIIGVLVLYPDYTMNGALLYCFAACSVKMMRSVVSYDLKETSSSPTMEK